jgi:hypothetical protein
MSTSRWSAADPMIQAAHPTSGTLWCKLYEDPLRWVQDLVDERVQL